MADFKASTAACKLPSTQALKFTPSASGCSLSSALSLLIFCLSFCLFILLQPLKGVLGIKSNLDTHTIPMVHTEVDFIKYSLKLYGNY
jgi:hypothetical protein